MPLRSFQHDGTEWTVWDTHPTPGGALGGGKNVADAYVHGWLTFQCDVEKRRLVPVPGEWFDLTEAQLAQLLEQAAPVRLSPGSPVNRSAPGASGGSGG